MPIIKSLSSGAAASGLPRDVVVAVLLAVVTCYHHVPTVNQRLLLQLIGS
jgi:hypothetical protein